VSSLPLQGNILPLGGAGRIIAEMCYPPEVTKSLKKQGTEAVLETIDDPRWQHMIGTVTLHRKDPDAFMPLKHLFSWLLGIEAEGRGARQ
jgi:hypothetical protein